MEIAFRRTALLLSFACFMLASAAQAGDSFSALRSDNDAIDQMLGALPSGGMHGTLNKIAGLLDRKTIASLPAGSSEDIPQNVERLLVDAIGTLGADVGVAIDTLGPDDLLTLIQVVDVVLMERTVELTSDQPWVPCRADEDCPNAVLLQELDHVAGLFIPAYGDLVLHYEQLTAGDPSLPAIILFPDEAFTARGFGTIVDEIRETLGYATGVPSID
jgi:hypothetical protein